MNLDCAFFKLVKLCPFTTNICMYYFVEQVIKKMLIETQI